MVAQNQTSVNVVFRPSENKEYSGGSVTVDNYFFYPNDGASDLLASFESPIIGQGYLASYDFISEGFERWDLISYLLFGQSNYLLKIWQENKHLSESNKRNFAPTPGTPFFVVPLTDEEKAENILEQAATLPPWKQ